MAHYSNNVHQYDGQLNEVVLSSKFNSSEEALECILQIPKKVPLSCKALEIFKQLVVDIGTEGNHDQDNHLRVEDLLYEIAYLLLEVGLTLHSQILEEQLLDMASGMCPQGRTTRLCQVIHALKS